MSLRCYRRESFNHTHENLAFLELYKQLEHLAERGSELVYLFGNVFVNGVEIDAIIVKPHAIIVVDLKHCGGRITFSENGNWTADGIPIKGGNKPNPFLQLRTNKFTLLNWLSSNNVFDRSRNHDLGRISALALFDKPIEFDRRSLPPKVEPWFHVTDMDRCMERIEAIYSDKINLDASEMECMAAKLMLDEFSPPGAIAGIAETPVPPKRSLPDRLVAPLGDLLRSLTEDGQTVHVVQGMLGTGVDEMLRYCYEQLRNNGEEVVVLAPNRSIAERMPIPAASLYSHIYDTAQATSEGDLIVFPSTTNQDPSSTIYLVSDAHLVSSSQMELDLHRYGSGRLLDDFLAYAMSADTKHQVVFFGDPYQLGRGSSHHCSLDGDHLHHLLGMPPAVLELPFVKDLASQPARIRNAVAIASQIRKNAFNSLSLNLDEGLAETPDLAGVVTEAFSVDRIRPKLITYTNLSANGWNRVIRAKLMGNRPGLQAGDVVHIHNSPVAWSTESDELVTTLQSGAFAEVQAVRGAPETIAQSLKGRPHPVEIKVDQVEIRPAMSSDECSKLYYFLDFLEAETPQLRGDMLIALRVNALKRQRESVDGADVSDTSALRRAALLRSDPYLNAAQIRYGYALTLHRAQGRTYPSVFADLETEQSKMTEDYFRWIYTLLAVSTGQLVIANVPTITPFTGCDWDCSQAKLGTARSRNLIPYDPNQELPRNLPTALREQPACLVNLYLHVVDSVAQDGLKVHVEAHHKFQEIYKFESGASEDCVLSLSYNKRYEVTRIEPRQCSSEAFADRVTELLTSDISLENAFQRLILDELSARIGTAGFRVSSITHRPYREIYAVQHPIGNLTLHLDYNDKGFVTRIAPQEYSTEDLVTELRQAVSI